MTFQENLNLRINYAKFDVALRNRRLVKFAEQRIGKATGQVYHTVLQCSEPTVTSCRKDLEYRPEDPAWSLTTPTVSVPMVSSYLDLNVNLQGTIGKGDRNKSSNVNGQGLELNPETGILRQRIPTSEDRPLSNGVNGTHPKIKREDEDEDEDEDVNGDDDHSRDNDVRQHLLLLADEPYHFIHREMRENQVRWEVEFGDLSRQLRDIELEKITMDRFGLLGVRITRILMRMGRLDEKQIQQIALTTAKELRQTMTIMHQANFIELQEMPRDTARQPNRMLYFWFYDPERLRRLIIEDSYKAMTRCLQRARVEREAVQSVIDKSERTDVVGREEELMGEGELEILRDWRHVEERLLGEVARLDDLVAVLRDY